MGNLVKTIARMLLLPIYLRVQTGRWPLPQPDRRVIAINQLVEYLIVSEVPGDYLEFGVAWGSTFAYACKAFSSHSYFKNMKFFALDSFEGLPEPKGIDAQNGYTSHFFQSQYACTEQQFVKNLKKAK